MNPSPDPRHITVSKSKGIQVDWADGVHSEYGLEYLRDHCPCATCAAAREKASASTAPPTAPFPLYQPALKIESVEPVGNYAIKIRWSDGHDTGFYSFEYLQEIRPPG